MPMNSGTTIRPPGTLLIVLMICIACVLDVPIKRLQRARAEPTMDRPPAGRLTLPIRPGRARRCPTDGIVLSDANWHRPRGARIDSGQAPAWPARSARLHWPAGWRTAGGAAQRSPPLASDRTAHAVV